jgi:putative restriction endonuclease
MATRRRHPFGPFRNHPVMKLHVFPTNREWFRFLGARPDLDEVNFWRPGNTAFRSLAPGEPLLFRLHSPVNRIAGFGFFVHYSRFPINMVWDAFGEKNGMASFAEFHARIERLRARLPGERMAPDAPIGCIVLTSPVFLPEHEWIRVPDDYPQNAVSGRGYDATTGSGAALMDWVQATVARLQPAAVRERTQTLAGAVYGQPGLEKRRLGQGAFRLLVTDRYEKRCALSGERTLPILEAAHIRPVAAGGQHAADNGILLRTDIHRLYDLGYIGVTPKHEVVVSRFLREEWQNGRMYYDMAGRRIRMPATTDAVPSPEHLAWHMDTVFRA